MTPEVEFTQMTRLPPWVKAKIHELGILDIEVWIMKKIPALSNKSVAELAATDEGQAILRDYFSKVIGRF